MSRFLGVISAGQTVLDTGNTVVDAGSTAADIGSAGADVASAVADCSIMYYQHKLPTYRYVDGLTNMYYDLVMSFIFAEY